MSATPGNTAQAATAPINNTQVPKHEQLRLIILKLAKEELEPGARLPSERTLMDSYGVSRITVRAAIGRLVNEGHLVRVPAKDRKSTRLNSSHVEISYAVFCLKKKN